jgi:hypothetical protein
MKAFLERFAAIVGTVTLTLLTLSVSHEYGYFLTIGRQFQTFLSASDYIINAVQWLPVGVILMYSAISWDSLKLTPTSGNRSNSSISRWMLLSMLIVAFVVLASVFIWPPDPILASMGMIYVVFGWALTWRKVYAKITVDPQLQDIIRDGLRFGIPVIVWMFL